MISSLYRRQTRCPRVLALALGLAVALTVPAVSAHAIVTASVPKTNDTLSGDSVTVSLQFNSRIDRQRSRFRIIGPGEFSLALTINDDEASDRISARPAPLTTGDYTLEWQVLGADGHITRGFIPFHIKAQ